jgi:hypothetical protein
MNYKLTLGASVIRLDDGASIPSDPLNVDYQAYLAWVAAGNTPLPVVVPTLTQNSAALVIKIRADASKIVGDVIGNLGNEYVLAKTDADAFKAAAYLGTVPASVASWAAAKGWTAQQACDDILTAAANWLGAQNAIRSSRLARAEAAKVCTTQAQLDTIAAQWAGFVAAIRSQLGV